MDGEIFRRDFTEYLEEAVGHENALIALSALRSPSSASVRLNPHKNGASFPCGTEAVPWNGYGLMLESRPSFTLDPYLHAGGYYVQDSSSMFVGHVLRQLLPDLADRIGRPVLALDLCAAPGGKATDAAASLRQVFGDSFLLVANEVVRQRAAVLADNAAVWGDPCVMVTSSDPERFLMLPETFDIIICDVPCSGEGMFRKDPKALEQWSPETVSLCEARQRRIVADAWESLASGGILLYSTCTFNTRENDGNVEWICSSLGGTPIDVPGSDGFAGVLKTRFGHLLVPGLVKGEGQYCAAIRKKGEAQGREKRQARKRSGGAGGRCQDSPGKRRGEDAQLLKLAGSLFSSTMRIFSGKDGRVRAIPEKIAGSAGTIASALNVLSAGCEAGMLKGRDFVPSSDLALSLALSPGAFPSAELDRQTALSYLHKDAISLPDAPRGFVRVCYGGLGLGFVKNLGSRCNNLHPASRRIRMDITAE